VHVDDVQRRGSGPAMGFPTLGSPVAHAEAAEPLGVRKHSPNGRRLSVHPGKSSLPAQVPNAARFPDYGLATRQWGSFQNGTEARDVLCRLLLGLDVDPVCRRRDEPFDHRRPERHRAAGKADAAWRCPRRDRWGSVDRLRSGSDFR